MLHSWPGSDSEVGQEFEFQRKYRHFGKVNRLESLCPIFLRAVNNSEPILRIKVEVVVMFSPYNLFADLPNHLPAELFTKQLETDHFCIERIVSHGHASPEGFWYDQEQHEWVVVLKGAARLHFEGDELPVELRPGDFLNIPAHQRHRLEWTTPDEPTIWLAIYYQDNL